MGNYLNKNDEISEQLKKEYEVQSLPYLLHRKSQQSCILLKLTAHSILQSSKIQQAIEEYSRSKCQSISKLRSNYHVENSGYCSDQQCFYLIFEGHNNYTLKDELVKRKDLQSAFSQAEIEQIIKTFLCGLREYDHRFQREYENLSVDRLVLDIKSKRIYLADPWLTFPQRNSESYPISYYSSPQKLKATYQNKLQEYNPFLSNLYSIGIIALELQRLTPPDTVYIHKRQINQQELKSKIRQFRSERLRSGIQCLVMGDPAQRKKIYQIWGIQNKQNHYLESIINKVASIQEIDPKIPKTTTNTATKKFQFPPSHSQQPSLKIVKSQAILNQQSQKTNHYPPININPQSFHQPQQLRQFPKIATDYQHISIYKPPTQITATNSYLQSPLQQPVIVNSYERQQQQHPLIGQRPPNFSQILAYQMKKNEPNKIQYQNPNIFYNPQPAINVNYPSQKYSQQTQPQQKQSESINLPNSLSSYKQSFLYYQPIKPQGRTNDITVVQNPVRQNLQVIKDQNPIKLQKIECNQPQKNEIKPIELIQNTERHYQQEEQHPQTPHRVNKKRNHFNSTIVEVKDDEDTPQQQQSQSAEEVAEEYVVEQYQTGSRYEGFKSNQMRNGQGKFYYQDGGYYQGHWKNNKMDGYGKLYYEGGKLAYEGEWSQDEFNGIGKVYNDNPVHLDAPFDYTDFGLVQDYWEYYEGTLSHDTKQGRGKIMLSNQEYFEGDFHNDLVQGFGKFSALDRYIQGIWRQSKLIKIISIVKK